MSKYKFRINYSVVEDYPGMPIHKKDDILEISINSPYLEEAEGKFKRVMQFMFDKMSNLENLK